MYRGMLITIAMLCVLVIRASIHTMMVSRYSSSVYLSYVLSICMLIGCIADTDLITCYPIAILLWNATHALLVHVLYTVRRAAYTVSHLYLGSGLYAVLRSMLTYIEYVSTLFRSVSLSLRIVCNSIAGHILLAVLYNMHTSMMADTTSSTAESIVLLLLPLLALKCSTSLIQGVVYCRLLDVYYSDTL
uniref:ATP synthase subunit a n=1 Tax=Rhynchopus euleeides TaxID=630703 RepID=A0A2D2AJU5_9EUGL|nr:ATP synthase F0 subunit a [Rhynchopus euleeides]